MKQAYYSELLRKFYLTEEDCQKAEEHYKELNKEKLEFEEAKKAAQEKLNKAQKDYDIAQDNYLAALHEYNKYDKITIKSGTTLYDVLNSIKWW